MGLRFKGNCLALHDLGDIYFLQSLRGHDVRSRHDEGHGFGIDERLKTFSTAMLTGVGAILFQIGGEAVEGLCHSCARRCSSRWNHSPGSKPVMRVADRFSGRILVSSYSETEVMYLVLCCGMEDNIGPARANVLKTPQNLANPRRMFEIERS